MKKARMNISHSRFILSKLKIFGEIVTTIFEWGGGYFPFFTENRPQKHKKHAFLHTSQANGGARAPPPPLATLLGTGSGTGNAACNGKLSWMGTDSR